MGKEMQINGNWGLPWSKVDCGCLEEAGGLCLSAGGPGERTILGKVSVYCEGRYKWWWDWLLGISTDLLG